MVEGGMSCVKYTLFAFNLIFCIFGLTLLGLGIYVQVQLHMYLDFFDTDINGPAILLIIVGVVTVVVAFFGCCGAIKENYCMVITFAVLVGLIFVCELGAGIAGFVLKGKVDNFVRKEMTDSTQNYGRPDHGGVDKSWDALQQEFKCCGVHNYTDWESNKFLPNNTLPKSCCSDKASNCSASSTTLWSNSTGCLDRTEGFLKDNVAYFAGAAVALGLIEIAGVVIACMLARSINSQYEIA